MKISARRVMGIAVIVLAGYLILSLIIKTEKDVIKQLIKETKEAVEQEDIDKCMSFIHPEYHYHRLNYEGLRKCITEVLKKIKPKENKVIKQKITIKGKVTDLRLEVITYPGEKSPLFRPFRSSWRLKLVKEDKKWWITEIEYL